MLKEGKWLGGCREGNEVRKSRKERVCEAEMEGEARWIPSGEMDVHTVSERVLSHSRILWRDEAVGA